jgi:hypothetical protein
MSKPMQAHNVIEFTLEPVDAATRVNWAMQGRAPYIAKVLHTVFDMDSMIGKDFEAGLADLKSLAEQ